MRIDVRASRQPEPATTPAGPPCAHDLALFSHESLDAPPVRSKVTQAVWAEYRALLDRAREACAGCPLFVDCLYRSVVQVDVSGYVGCTTTRERRQIRRALGVTVEADDLDEAAGVRVEGRPLDHASVLATRRAYPDDTFEQLAARLDCSLSTVKRHLRRARREADSDAPARATATRTDVPGVDEVLDAFDAVVEDDR
ncbi:MAG: WhiB family transcriptional regulator [Nocardioidaceae bacterium]|nr:WhiB family transcriptional regulator [Nocardioidaceae bacterium]